MILTGEKGDDDLVKVVHFCDYHFVEYKRLCMTAFKQINNYYHYEPIKTTKAETETKQKQRKR